MIFRGEGGSGMNCEKKTQAEKSVRTPRSVKRNVLEHQKKKNVADKGLPTKTDFHVSHPPPPSKSNIRSFS